MTQGTTTTESYTYDVVGNRLSSLSVPSYTYNTSNELTSISAAAYTYDKNGNTLSKTISGATTQYTWDFENRLGSVVLPGTGRTATFKYDPFGRRIQKAFTQGTTTATTNYVYDGPNGIEELDQNANVLARYTEGAGIDEPLAELRSGTSSYYQQDGLGSVTSLSNGTGALANTYVYDSFGNVAASTGSVVNPFQYTGRDYDLETGLQYYRARYYDTNIGRFISEDPIRFRAGADFYVYVANNSQNYLDSLGLQASTPQLGGCKPGPNAAFFICCKHNQIGFCDGPMASSHQNDWISDCWKVHERVHIADIKKQYPNLCSGQKDGASVCVPEGTRPDLECRAYTAQEQCLSHSPENTQEMKNAKKGCGEHKKSWCSKVPQ